MRFDEWLEKQATDPTLLDQAESQGKSEALRLLVLLQASCYRRAWNAAVDEAAGKAFAFTDLNMANTQMRENVKWAASRIVDEICPMKAGESEVRNV